VNRGVVMAKQPGLFSPKFGATSSRVLTQSTQNFAVESGVHSLACLNRYFELPQPLYRWQHQSGIFLISPRNVIWDSALAVGGVTRNFGGWGVGGAGGGSTNSVEDRGQREWGSGGGSPLFRCSTQFAKE
jgi:hypothetical protein